MSSLLDLRTLTRRYINEEDATNSHFTDAEINDYLNQGVTFLGTQMEWPFQVASATSVANQALYGLPADFIAMIDAYFDNKKLYVLERDDLSALSAVWQQVQSGEPTTIYKASNATIGLYPAPDATNAGKVIQIQYIQIPATLVSDPDVPNLHLAFQMCLPFYAAFICDHKLGNDKKSEVHLQRYDQHRKALMARVQRFSDDLFRFRWSGSTNGRDYIGF